MNPTKRILGWLAVVAALFACAAPVQAQPKSKPKPPNILVIWGDDIGWQNVSAYGMGTMGYTTPNIDRIGMEGVRFTDHYAQPSCTAGRAAFITGQYPIRSGMTTVGSPGDKLGLQAASPSLAEVMKQAGYRTGHFGKNHLGDRNEHLPTVHGFDEFFGNLYHLNTQEEQEQRDYPELRQGLLRQRRGLREEVRHARRDPLPLRATRTTRPSTRVSAASASRRCTDTGPLTQERMKDFDAAEAIPKATDFMKKSQGRRQALLRVAQRHAHAPLHAPERQVALRGREVHQRSRPARQRHAPA